MAVRASVADGGSRRVETAVRRAAAGQHLVLAVSGGRDSMALLHAAARAALRAVRAVATFDHGTGPAATRAAELVASEATRLGFPVVMGRAEVPGHSEADWRAARHRFLGQVAARVGGTVTTAHTRDDQVETVLMRVLRDAGARGLAGLYAEGAALRPLLDLTREEVAAYADQAGIRWVEDPTNASKRFLRNRIRLDLLPVVLRAQPDFDQRLISVSRAAASWRRQIDALAARIARVEPDGVRKSVSVAAADLAPHTRNELSVLWPAIATTVGIAMDWRGTERAAAFTTDSRVGARVPLSGGWEISRKHDRFELRHAEEQAPRPEARLASGIQWGGWRFVATRDTVAVSDEWVAQLPVNAALTVRRWQPGDRMRAGASSPRNVKRFLSDARVSGARRGQWPVVLAGDEIVWIPGVRRSDAAAVRPGRPGVLYRCELDDR
jgi:tRNA(Ile)-lysidine synthase